MANTLKQMKKFILLVAAVVTLAVRLNAQDWQLNIEQAKQIAQNENKTIILVFQGSDWCAPCIRLDKEVWSTQAFIDYSKEHFVMLKADFPRKKQHALDEEQTARNKKLAETYNQQGYFPYVVLLDAEGKVLGSTGYKKMAPSEYIAHLESFIQ